METIFVISLAIAFVGIGRWLLTDADGVRRRIENRIVEAHYARESTGAKEREFELWA